MGYESYNAFYITYFLLIKRENDAEGIVCFVLLAVLTCISDLSIWYIKFLEKIFHFSEEKKMEKLDGVKF